MSIFFQILLLSLFLCSAANKDPLEAIENKRLDTFVPAPEYLIKQQTEAIRRIVQAKSLELQHSVDINDSILISKCQQLAKLQDGKKSENNSEIVREYIDKEKDAIIDKEDPNNPDPEDQDSIHEESTHNENKIKTPEILNLVKVDDEQEMTSIKPQVPVSKSPNTPKTETQITHLQTQTVQPQQNILPSQFPTTTLKSSTTTKSQKYGSSYGKPFYYIYHRLFPEKTEKPTTTTTAATTTTTEAGEYYTENLRFILRMPYLKNEPISNYPWEFDRYAYYPKHMQPDYVNVAVPYSPVFHMIRRLIVPGKIPGSYIVETKT